MELFSSHLTLREFKATDLESVHGYASSVEATRCLEWGPNQDISETKDFLEGFLMPLIDSPDRTDIHLAIELVNTHQMVGSVRLNTAEGGQQGWMGVIVSPDCWGQGIALEALHTLYKYGFKELGLHRIYGEVDPRNKGSIRLLEKLGMQLEGHLRENLYSKDEWCDSLVYSILDKEFKE